MVDALANWALETLRDLLIEEVKLLYGVEDKVVDLGRDLQKMRRFLKDADKWQDGNNSAILRGWVSDLIDLATRAEDVLEEHAVSKIGAKDLKEMLKKFACILCECWSLHTIGREIAGIMSRMAELTKEMESIRNWEGSSSFESNDDQRSLRQTYGHGIEEHFVGMKNDIDLLVSLVQNDDRSSRVISICGMGGLGKTTLARIIYQHNFGFELPPAWVCITQKLQAKSIFHDILRQLLPRESNQQMVETELVRKIYDTMKANKCLVVLDDIWETDHWDILKKAFPLAESNSKILLTTRNQRVADVGFVHKLDLLTEDECWDLLQKIALPIHEFEGLTTANLQQFEPTGRELVRKCGRLPLLVSVIGGDLLPPFDLRRTPYLRRTPCLEDWINFLKKMDMYLKHGQGVNDNDKRVKQVLSLSYNILPYYLKLCFLYLGCFPEDRDIDVGDVYLIWMAEGLISSDDKGQDETLMDVAKRYLYELASKYMVQVKLTKSSKSYRLHDLMRDLCLSKGKEENFFEDSQGKIRRLAINLVDDNSCNVAQSKNANLRSLLLLSKWRLDGYDITNFWQNLLSNTLLRSLKVLVLEDCKFKDNKLPDAVGKLVMLKHLSIRHSWVSEVPEFVCKLPCLQSMDLRNNLMLRHMMLPNSIDMMGRLRHLFLDPWRIKKIDGGKLRLNGSTELETLIGFSSETFDTNYLLKLTNLQSFDGYVYDIESLSVVVDHITKLKDQLREASLKIKVRDLSSEQSSPVFASLMHCPLSHLEIDGRLSSFPTWDSELLQNLKTLCLDQCEIGEDPMVTLQHLPTLRILLLCRDAFAVNEMVCGSRGFPQLERLTLLGLNKLEKWRVEKGAMPNLSYLWIDECPKLKMIPQGIIFMASITYLGIRGMPSNFMERLRRGGEDYHKISHIPSIHLGYN